MGELANCPRCNALFVKSVRDVCNNCFKEEEAQFEKVYTYVKKKENRKASVSEVSEATGVEERLIMKFIKQKRLSTVQFPNLSYGCERCGSPIQEGKLCSNCRGELYDDLTRDQKQAELRASVEKERNRTYFAVDKKFGRDS
ncbi:TIGR03826 family flagellar region protein [Salirhabdus sp. Marseille-P4669]|uniref:TIGR03826 family flagellar region protein n=1 Tax=Salirhabdus sp. Marseille-P4669 TaxID=2042310 RepID=UPI000C7B7ECE|nr:TIGR03826 family flagellar region protein [Salirhabdus sp. Marseille-P4669]